MKVRCLLAMFVFLFMPMGQAWSAADNLDPLKPLHFLIGDWVGQAIQPIDVPELEIEKGMDVRIQNSYKPMLNENAIELTMSRSCDGKPLSTNREIMGWDPVKERYVSWCYGTHGGIALAVWKKKGDLWTTKCVPHFYDRHGFGIPSEFEMKIIDDETVEVSGRFGHRHITAKNTKVKNSE